MLGFINKGIAKVFGTKSDRDIKELTPYVNLINEEFQQLVSISDDDLRNKTEELKEFIAKELKHIDDELETLHQKIDNDPNLDINEKEGIFGQIDGL